jgi:hypothetical protein
MIDENHKVFNKTYLLEEDVMSILSISKNKLMLLVKENKISKFNRYGFKKGFYSSGNIIKYMKEYGKQNS